MQIISAYYLSTNLLFTPSLLKIDRQLHSVKRKTVTCTWKMRTEKMPLQKQYIFEHGKIKRVSTAVKMLTISKCYYDQKLTSIFFFDISKALMFNTHHAKFQVFMSTRSVINWASTARHYKIEIWPGTTGKVGREGKWRHPIKTAKTAWLL